MKKKWPTVARDTHARAENKPVAFKLVIEAPPLVGTGVGPGLGRGVWGAVGEDVGDEEAPIKKSREPSAAVGDAEKITVGEEVGPPVEPV